MRSHILVHGATTRICDKPFIFKNKIEKEGLPRDGPADLEAGVLLNYEHLPFEQKVKVKSDSSYSFQFNEMASPAGLEPAAFCLEVA